MHDLKDNLADYCKSSNYSAKKLKIVFGASIRTFKIALGSSIGTIIRTNGAAIN